MRLIATTLMLALLAHVQAVRAGSPPATSAKNGELQNKEVSEAKSPPRNKSKNEAVIKRLLEPLDMVDFQLPMTLRTAIDRLGEKSASEETKMLFLVDVDSYRAFNPDSLEDIFQTSVRFPAYPKRMSLLRALQLMIAKIEYKSTFLIRNGVVEIMPAQQATTKSLLGNRITAQYSSEPLETVLMQLSDQSGLSIHIDPRIKEQRGVRISANFANDVTLQGVLETVVQLAGIDWYAMPGGGVMITTVEEATNARRQETERQTIERQATDPQSKQKSQE